MKSPNWKDIAELVGISAIVASLIFVGLELKQSRDIALAEIYQQRANVGMELTRWPRDPFINQALQKLLKGESLDQTERFVWDSLLNEAMYFFDNNHYQFQLGLLSDDTWEANRRSLANFISEDEAWRDYWSRYRTQWRDSFVTVVDDIIAEVDAQRISTESPK